MYSALSGLRDLQVALHLGGLENRVGDLLCEQPAREYAHVLAVVLEQQVVVPGRHRKTYEQMHVVRRYFHRVNLDVMTACNLYKQLPRPLSDITAKYPLSILRRPHQVILGVVNGVTG